MLVGLRKSTRCWRCNGQWAGAGRVVPCKQESASWSLLPLTVCLWTNPLTDPHMPYLCNGDKVFPYWRQNMTERRLGFSSGSNTHALTRWLPTRVEDITAQYFSTMWKPGWATGRFYLYNSSDGFMFAFLVGPFEMKLGCVGGVLLVGKVDGHNSHVLFTMSITSLSIWKVLNKHLLNWIEYYCLITN